MANAVFATGYAGTIRAVQPGLALPRRWHRGSAVVVPLSIAVAGARVRIDDPFQRAEFSEWVLLRIPLGTVYSEELIFRATLDPLLCKYFGRRTGRLLAAAAFGLWHVHPARRARQSVPAVVAVTAAAGMALSVLTERTGSLLAPALVHLVTNVGGAAFASGRR